MFTDPITMQTLVAERQATMRTNAEHQRLARQAIRASRATRSEVATLRPSPTTSPAPVGRLRSIFRLAPA